MIVDARQEAHARVVLPLTRLHEGTALPLSGVTELRIRLRDRETGTVLNARDGSSPMAPDVLQMGSDVVWTLQPADNVVVHPTRGYELHDFEVSYVYGAVLQRLTGHVRVENLGVGVLTPPPVPEPGAPVWSFYLPLAGDRPGRTFTLPTIPVGAIVVYQGGELHKVSTPGLGEFALAGAVVTTGFDVQPGDALWAHVYA